MKAQKYRIDRLLRWAGRIIASITALWFLVVLIGSAITEGAGPITIETGTLVFLGMLADRKSVV